MRTLAIGDIHGCLKPLVEMADFVGFTPQDTIITLGDYVDRGPHSKGVVDFLIELQQSHHLISLKGNHEVLMLEALNDDNKMEQWLRPAFGGGPTLMSYDAISTHKIPEEHLSFLSKAMRFYETPSHIFVHGGIEPNLDLLDQSDATVFWKRFDQPQRHYSGKRMVCGHSSQSRGIPNVLPHAVCIDTFVYGGGWLTCLDVDSNEYWQTNERGERRTGHLSEC